MRHMILHCTTSDWFSDHSQEVQFLKSREERASLDVTTILAVQDAAGRWNPSSATRGVIFDACITLIPGADLVLVYISVGDVWFDYFDGRQLDHLRPAKQADGSMYSIYRFMGKTAVQMQSHWPLSLSLNMFLCVYFAYKTATIITR